MPAVEFRIVVFDQEMAAARGRWGDVSFCLDGLAKGQAEALVQYTEMFSERVRNAMGLIKHGTGEVLTEEGDAPPAQIKSDASRKDLAAELMAEGDDED